MFSFVPLCFLSLLGAVQSKPETWNPENLFPLTPGNQWTYLVRGSEDRLVITVAPREKGAGSGFYRLEARIKDEFIGSEHLALRSGGLYRHRIDFIEIDPALLLCKLPVEPGSEWKVNYRIGTRTATLRFVAEIDNVTVPAGQYKAVVVHADGGEDKARIKFSTWYAPKVGMVKQTFDDGKNRYTLELEKFTLVGKKP